MKHLILYCFLFFSLAGTAQNNIISNFSIRGNKKIKTSFIKNITTIALEKPLDSIVLKRDIEFLKRLPSVANASYQVTESTLDNGYEVTYIIVENFTLIPSANVYTTNDEEFAFRLGLYEFNLFGRNISFGGFYQDDIYSSYGINFRAPFLFNKHLGLAINYQNWTTQEPVFLDNGIADYRYNNTSYEILGLCQVDFYNRFEIGANYFNEDYQYLRGVTDPNVPQALNVDKLLFKGIYEYNNLNFTYQYVSGFRSIFNFQYVISTDDVLPGFVIGWNDFLYYKKVGHKGNWASRLRMGLASNNDTPFAPFALDNNLNIRGVGNLIDRGTGVVVLNTEYRQTLIEKKWFVLQGNAFIDAGSWRQPAGSFSDFINAENIRIYPGIGVRFMHKRIFNAIFRIDYGYGISENATNGFVFGIGQYF